MGLGKKTLWREGSVAESAANLDVNVPSDGISDVYCQGGVHDKKFEIQMNGQHVHKKYTLFMQSSVMCAIIGEDTG
jgi:hypothetical protein